MKIWKTIPFEDNYEISNNGEIRNIKTNHIKSVRSDRYGYDRVTLYPSGKTYTIHRLVAIMFLSKADPSFNVVNHKDGDKRNNNVLNLEWCDQSHNAKHRDTVLRSKWTGQLNPQAKIDVSTAKNIKYGNFDGMSNSEIGKLFGLKSEHVRKIRTGERWKHI